MNRLTYGRAAFRALMICAVIMTGAAMLTGCRQKEKADSGKLSVVTTLFPQYDFARQIAGDRAEVTLLLKPGTEAHDYDPTPSDMIKINDADLFIYTGKYMEAWAADIVGSIDNKKLHVLDVSAGITLYKSGEDDGHIHAGGEEGDADSDGSGSPLHEYDPHIWTNPKNAISMIENILAELIRIDGESEEYYRSNAEKYISEIRRIDSDIRETVAAAKYDTIYFGGRFAMLYFAKEYGLHYESAFDSCSSETEPGAKLIAQMVDEMKQSGAKTVFYEELANTATAEAIAGEIGGSIRLLHSCHNISGDELKNGATYVSLMRQNIESLRAGLN